MAIKQLTLIKRGNYYLFRYDPETDNDAMIKCLIDKAKDLDCDLDWFDIAVLSHQMGPELARAIMKVVKVVTEL